MASRTYNLFAQAMGKRKQVLCTYEGYKREVCPNILGHSDGEEKALTFQFGGSGSKGLAPGGQWRCLFLSRVSDVSLREGPWISGGRHGTDQVCVKEVDLDVNPDSPYHPKRPLPLRS